MREYCEEALKLGGEQLRVFSQPKHITVILNPRSKKSKSRKQFNDFVAPILHCAGYKVSLVETENQGILFHTVHSYLFLSFDDIKLILNFKTQVRLYS